IGGLVFGQDVGHGARVRPFPARFLRKVRRPDDARRPRRLRSRRGADRQFELAFGRHRPVRARRHVEGGRHAVEGRTAPAQRAECLAAGRRLSTSGNPHEASLAAARFGRDGFAGLQPVELETDIGPAGAPGRDARCATPLPLRLHEELRHQSFFPLSGSRGSKAMNRPWKARAAAPTNSVPQNGEPDTNSKTPQPPATRTIAIRSHRGRKNGSLKSKSFKAPSPGPVRPNAPSPSAPAIPSTGISRDHARPGPARPRSRSSPGSRGRPRSPEPARTPPRLPDRPAQ